LRLSSIDGWSEDKLPKLLIVWSFEKISTDAFPSITRPGKASKKRDIKAIVKGYELFLITKGDDSIVPWDENPPHAELVRMDWTEEWLSELKQKAQWLNDKYPERPINFQLSFKNGKYLRLQYKITDYSKLPKCPDSVSKLISPNLDLLIGTEFMLKKDHSNNGGPCGWYDNEMARWENKNNLKKSGILYIRKKNHDWVAYPEFSEGKQDYWSGFAIDFLMAKEIPGFEDQGGHITGSDHTLNFPSIQHKQDEISNIVIFSRFRNFVRRIFR
tara:strand:- start:44 stop:859 length:816 start_codon:yes stop_codon:yes gene_type:complete